MITINDKAGQTPAQKMNSKYRAAPTKQGWQNYSTSNRDHLTQQILRVSVMNGNNHEPATLQTKEKSADQATERGIAEHQTEPYNYRSLGLEQSLNPCSLITKYDDNQGRRSLEAPRAPVRDSQGPGLGSRQYN